MLVEQYVDIIVIVVVKCYFQASHMISQNSLSGHLRVMQCINFDMAGLAPEIAREQ